MKNHMKNLKQKISIKKFATRMLSLLTVGCILLFTAGCNNTTTSKDSGSEPRTVDKTFTIGVIQFADHPSLENCHKGFVEGLKAKGFEVGKNITIDHQVGQADSNLTNQIAQNFASKSYDLIVGIATPAAQAAYNAAARRGIPVIFNAVTDPIAAGLQNTDGSNLPGVTGTSDILPIENQLKMIRAFQPNAKSLGILYTTSETNSAASLRRYEELAGKYGFEIISQSVTAAADVAPAAQSLVAKVDALTNLTDNTIVQNLQTILAKCQSASIPYYGSEEEQVRNGCLATEGIDYFRLGEKTGEMAAEIFNGKKAEELPIVTTEDSTPFYRSDILSQLGLTLPEEFKDAKDLVK